MNAILRQIFSINMSDDSVLFIEAGAFQINDKVFNVDYPQID